MVLPLTYRNSEGVGGISLQRRRQSLADIACTITPGIDVAILDASTVFMSSSPAHPLVSTHHPGRDHCRRTFACCTEGAAVLCLGSLEAVINNSDRISIGQAYRTGKCHGSNQY